MTFADLLLALRVTAGFTVAMATPERWWAPLGRFVGHAAVRLRPGWRAEQLRTLERYLGPGEGRQRTSCLVERVASGHESRLRGLAEYRPGGRSHSIRVTGQETINEALSEGRGVILCVGRMTFATLLTKVGLHEAGFSVSHLSRPGHGFGGSPFCVRFLNPIWTGVEERYLRERLIMPPDRPTGALRTLRRRPDENQIVSISVGDEGRKTTTADLLGGSLCLATGPFSLSASTGAPLFPVFTYRNEDGQFEVEIQPRLLANVDGRGDNRFQAVTREYAARLEPFVERFPGQWLS